MSHSYDENLSQNPFLKTFLHNYVDLFTQCVEEKWIICIPRYDSLPKYAFTLEDFTHHILRPLNLVQELSSKVNSTVETNLAKKSAINWNFSTLSELQVAYYENSILLENERKIEVLFNETFYTPDKLKYKILCISSPINSQIENLGIDQSADLWNLASLRDCIDFLWTNGRKKSLVNFDSYIKIFLNSNKYLEDLPLPTQRDLVYDLYVKCFNFTSFRKRNKDDVSPTQISENESAIEEREIQNFKLATESYILNGIYGVLINSITSAVALEDANINKIIQNVVEIHPNDLKIPSLHWENLSRAKLELSKLALQQTPLGKISTLKKTLNYFKIYDQSIEDSRGTISTDELLPIWVYLIIKSSVRNWSAQLQFLKQFRFSAFETPDSESSFFIVTLEASLLYLNSGKLNLLSISESDRDVGSSFEEPTGDYWLKSLFYSSENESVICDMFSAVRLGNIEKLESLIDEYEEERVKVSSKSKNFPYFDESLLCHPLCSCAKCAQVTKPVEPLDVPHVFELKNEDSGITLLHAACIFGRPKVVDYLLSAGADSDVEDNQGLTPLHYAASHGHQNALLLLLHNGAKIEPLDSSLNTPLHLGSRNGHESCVKALIYYAEHSKRVIEVSGRNGNGDTPLHFAARNGFLPIVQLLVEAGASITVTNNRSRNPMDVAHDIHVARILQRSMRRRSLVQMNHGDFVNIEVIKKSDTDDGLLMLITEPVSLQIPENNISEKQSPNYYAQNSPNVPRSRRNSTNSMGGGLISGTQSRKTSTVITPSFAPNTIFEHVVTEDFTTASNSSKKYEDYYDGILAKENEIKTSEDAMVFNVVNILPPEEIEPEHLRKVSVDSLEVSESSNYSQGFGTKRKRDVASNENDPRLRKLFSSIENRDIPLALFYLGIPPSELEIETNNLNTPFSPLPPCHPLCECEKCEARKGGLLSQLGLSLNVTNEEGFTPLHLAVKYNLHLLVKILLKYGADVNVICRENRKSAMELATERRYNDIAATLSLFWTKNIQI